MPPETRYATKGEISIAYQVVGNGPRNLVLVNGLLSHMALFWSDPAASAFMRRLASFARLILFDKPGTGLSDPVAGPPSLEQRVEDVRVVMDAAGVERASLLGYSEGGAPASVFAATYPERSESLILLETGLKFDWSEDYLPEIRNRFDDFWETHFASTECWGEGHLIAAWAPSLTGTPGFWQAAGSAERICASPGMAKALMRAARAMDARAAAAQISAPTLVLHRERDIVPVEGGRYAANSIPSAKLVVFPQDDHLIWAGTWEPIVDEIEEFLTGTRHRADPDRALAHDSFHRHRRLHRARGRARRQALASLDRAP